MGSPSVMSMGSPSVMGSPNTGLRGPDCAARSTMYSVKKDLGRKRALQVDLDHARRLLQSGLSLTATATQLGISRQTLRRRLAARGAA